MATKELHRIWYEKNKDSINAKARKNKQYPAQVLAKKVKYQNPTGS
jgi:hypothetical protein